MQYITWPVCAAVYSLTKGWREGRPTTVLGWWVRQQQQQQQQWCVGGCVRAYRRRRVAAAGHNNNNIYSAALKAPRKEESVINYLRVAYRTRPFPRPCAQIISCRRRCASEGTIAIQYNIILYDIILHQSVSHRRRLYSRRAAKETLI